VGTGTTDTYAYLDATRTAWQTGQATPTGSLLDADGSRLAVKTGSQVSWLVFDLHGSVAGLCPAGTTSLADAYRYDGFGRQVASAGSATNPFRYRGLLNLGADDTYGALLAMGARDYSSQLGVFTQEDSVQGAAANPATMNRFLYALANRATLVDPDGHFAEYVGGTAGGLIDPEVYKAAKAAETIKAAGGDPVSEFDPVRPLAEGVGWWLTGGWLRDAIAGPYRNPDPSAAARELYVAAGGVGLDAGSRNLENAVDDLEWRAVVVRRQYEQAMTTLHAGSLRSGVYGKVSSWLNREWEHTTQYFAEKVTRLPLVGQAKAAGLVSKALGLGGVVLAGVNGWLEQDERDAGRVMTDGERTARKAWRATLTGLGTAVGAWAGGAACSPGVVTIVVCAGVGGEVLGNAGQGFADLTLGLVDAFLGSR
jgi:RHS repeat-associated protein